MGNLGSMYRMSPTWKMAIFVILSLVTSQQILSQTDTASTFYFPLGHGNVWQYKEPPPPDQPYITEIRTGRDSTLSNSITYHALVTTNYGFPDTIQLRYVRQVGQKVYRYFPTQGEEFLIYDFSNSVGDTVAKYPSPINAGDTNVIRVIDTGIANIYGTLRRYMTFYNTEYPAPLYWIDMIVDSIGVISSETEPGYQLGLVGAVVNGQTYGVIADVRNSYNQVPSFFSLFQNYPNPFNPSTTISFQLQERSKVKATIWSLLGVKIRDLFDGVLPKGFHTVAWDGMGSDGRELSSGVYFYRLEAGQFSEVKKAILLR
jgi:hypothetical protein